MLPSKIRPTTSLSRLTTGLPELPPMMSAVETKLSGVSRFEPARLPRLVPARGELVGVLVAVGLGVLERTADRGERRDRLAVDLVALDHAEGEPEREGRVGIDRVALVLEEGPGDQGVVRGLHALDLVFALLADGAGVGVDGQGQLDHRVVAVLDRGLASLGQLLPHGDVGELGVARRRVLRGLLGRAAPQDLLDQRVVGHVLLPEGQRVGELGLLELGIDRGLGEEGELERLERRVAVLLEPIGVRLGLLLGQPHERRGRS